MIISVKNKKISKIKIGKDMIPSKGEIFIPIGASFDGDIMDFNFIKNRKIISEDNQFETFSLEIV